MCRRSKRTPTNDRPPIRGLVPSLRLVAQATAAARDPWWIIGSAALALHGIDPDGVGDVDLLTSTRDAIALLTAQGIAPAPGIPDDRFRSAVFGRWRAAGMTVETMGSFEVRIQHHWRPVLPATREPVACSGATLFVPTRHELVDLLRRFGRSTDLARAALLDQPSPRSAGPNAWGSSSDSG